MAREETPKAGAFRVLLGGDGTLLSAARVWRDQIFPSLGESGIARIPHGSNGERAFAAMDTADQGQGQHRERAMLDAKLSATGDGSVLRRTE